jgi:signal peptidase II
MDPRRRAIALAALTAVLVLVLDQALKVRVRGRVEVGERQEILGSVLRLVHVENDGVAFGRFAGNATLVGLIVVGALVALLAYFLTHLDVPLVWLPTGVLLGGALGNVLDRVRFGAVTDYLKLPNWPAFNLADVAITVGVVLLIAVVELDARRRERSRPDAEAPGGAAGPA